MLETLSSMITHQIIRLLLQTKSQMPNMSDNIALGEAIKYLNRHFEEDISVETLAKLSQLSKSHFGRLFSNSMGISPMEYLKNIRLQHAKKLLLKEYKSITQIAMACGFNSPAYFTKLFKEQYAVTPKEFALQHK